MASLNGQTYRKANTNNSNHISEITISTPISLRSFAGGFKGTIAVPNVDAQNVYTNQTVFVVYDPDNGNERTLLGIGTSVGDDNVLRYSIRGDFNWVATPSAGSPYYVSAFTSNIVTGEKGLLYIRTAPVYATNP
jgi:hypothetical protein